MSAVNSAYVFFIWEPESSPYLSFVAEGKEQEKNHVIALESSAWK
jgi:hypothetical protein